MSGFELFRPPHNTAHVDGLSIEKSVHQCVHSNVGTYIYRCKLFILSDISLAPAEPSLEFDAVEEKY